MAPSKSLWTLLTLSGALLLASCGQGTPGATLPTSPVATTPAPLPVGAGQPLRALGLYELSVGGLGQGQGQVKAAVARAGLQAQANEINGLSFDNISNVTVTDAAHRLLHLTATFKVTNTTGAPITLPTYIPVDTAGTDATDGETPFKNVTSTKGQKLTPPAGMVPERSKQLSGAVIQDDPNATPLVGNLDTAGLGLTLPQGTTAPGISHQGWQTTTLAAGASQSVSFAVQVPLQGNDVGDNDPFRFSLVFAVADSPAAITPALTPVGAVQGATPAGNADSPLNGQTVTVEGVVTSYLSGLSGYFVQEEGLNADRDASTSTGIFVYCGNSCSPLNVGDVVRVTGAVTEYDGATQIVPTGVTRLASGVPVPAAVPLTLPVDPATLERYEGMRLSFAQTLTVTNNFGYGRYGQLDLSNDGRLYNPTNGNGFTAAQSSLTLDDGQRAQNPLTLPYLNAQGTRRTGDTVTGLSGVWHAVANVPMLEPEGEVNFVDANPRLASPKAVGGSLRVGGANVLNYFTDLNTTYSSSGPRGANSAAELTRQRTKMANTLTGLNADVLTLMEVQNNGDTALNDIVAALNEKAGAGTYAAVSTGKVGTDAIKVAVIYKPGKVIPVGGPVTDTNSVYSRPPVAQTFRDRGTGGIFTVVANHLKSKGSCPSSGDVDTGQGCWNTLRVNQASQLLNFVQSLQTSTGDQDVILMGDFNSYGDEDPIKTIVAGNSGTGPFESLNKRIPAEDRYSYQFDGRFGYLDHALVSSHLSSQITGITEWHVNSDEPVTADYNTEFKAIPECVSGAGSKANTCQGKDLYSAADPFRASDHDPVLVGLNLSADAGTTPDPVATTALSANPASLSLTVGGDSASTTLTTTTQGYSGPLTVTTSNSAGLSVTPSAGSVSANGTFTVSVAAPAGTAAGTYPVTVTTTGDGGAPKATATLNVTVSSAPTTGKVNHLVISQVYGGGGASTGSPTFANDYVELFNPSGAGLSTSGMSLQYGSATSTVAFTNIFELPTATIQPGQYYLVKLGGGKVGGSLTPDADASGGLNLSATAGKIALATGTTGISKATDTAVVDFVGYGSANDQEGTGTATAPSTTTADIRKNGGCTDTNTNSADFTAATPAPHNTASPLNVCP